MYGTLTYIWLKSMVHVGKYSSLHGTSGHKKPLPMRGFFGRKFQQIPGTYTTHPTYDYIWPNYNIYNYNYKIYFTHLHFPKIAGDFPLRKSPPFGVTTQLKDVCPLF